MQTKIIEIEFEPETAFTLHSLQRPGGSTPSMGKFIDPQTGEYWLGKSEVGSREEDSKLTACKEKIANDIYGYFGIRVPRLRISYQPLAIQDQNALQTFQEMLGGTHAWHVMSRWLDRFDSYGYLPTFAGGDIHELSVTVEGQTRTLPERGLGHILAVAHWLNDVDVLNRGGNNVGYQLQLDETGQLYVQSCKIDPGYGFNDFEKVETGEVSKNLVLALPKEQVGHVIAFEQLPQRTQEEYLLTLKKIAATSDIQIANFFAHPNTQLILENISCFIQCLKNRRDGLVKLHEAALKTVQEIAPIIAPTAIPPILQRLYCQAKLQYETDVKEKAAFYVPLDVTASPHSEERIPMQTLWENFLGIPSSPLTTQATLPNTHTTSSTAAITHNALTTPSPIEKKTVLLLLGASGSGKSLSTQLLVEDCWQAFLQNPQTSSIPLRIELKQFSEKTVGQCIINTLLDEYRYSPQELRQLQAYRFVFILDGYDEMANQAKINLLQKHQVTESQYGQWQAQFIITCRDSYFQGLNQNLFYPPQGITELVTRYVSALTPAHQIDYLMRYKASKEVSTSAKILPDYAALLKENPHLHELLSNPFLLRIFRDALPQWQQDHPESSLKDLTRYDLYTAFMKRWFKSEALRLSMIQAKYLPDNLPERFSDFSLRLAFTMHVEKIDEVNVEEDDQKRWERFFSDQNETISEARTGCPLRRIGQFRYSFVHKSFLEYFVARRLWEALEKNDLSIWNQRLLPETWEVLQFLLEHWKQASNPILKDQLWGWIQGSKTNDQQSIVAANAITLLNHGGLSFIGEYGNLADVNIPGANLQNALLDHTCFRRANLRGVNLSRAFLRGTDLTQADLTDAIFGELPSMQLDNSVRTIAYSYDGCWLAVGTYKNIELWRGDRTTKVATLSGHTGNVNSVAFDPSGKYLVSGSGTFLVPNSPEEEPPLVAPQGEDNTVRLWEVETSKVLNTLTGHTDEVTCVAFDSTSEYLASGSYDETIRLWSVTTGKTLATLRGHEGIVTSVAFDSTSEHLASGSYDKAIRLWSVTTGKTMTILTGHNDRVTCVAFDSTSKRLASGSYDETIRLWSVTTGKTLATLVGHNSVVESIAFDPTGKYLASGSSDNTVRIWEVTTGETLNTFSGHTDMVFSVAFDPRGKHLASGSQDKTIRLWEVETVRTPKLQAAHTGYVTSVAFDPTGRRLASAERHGGCTLRLWEVKTGKILRTLAGHSLGANCVAFDSTGERLASGGNWDKTIRLWSVRTGNTLAILAGHTGFVEDVAFDPTGECLASGSDDKTIRLWSVTTGKTLTTLVGHDHAVNSIAFDPMGKYLASGSSDKTVRVWEIATGRTLNTLAGHTSDVRCIAFAPTGEYFASGSYDKSIRLWSVTTGKTLATLVGHDHAVNSIAFDPMGKYLASGSSDKTVRVWEIATGRTLNTLIAHTDQVESVAFNHTDEHLASGGRDKTIFFWQALNVKKTEWRCIRRFMQHPTLATFGALTHQTKLSETNQKLLIQRGAISTQPSFTNYRQSFWAIPKKILNTLSSATNTTQPTPVPAPLKSTSTIVTTILSFEATVLNAAQNLQIAIQQESHEELDPQAACSFMSTFLRAIRKDTLSTLQAYPEEHGIPTRWAIWLIDTFEKDPTLKALLKNPHPNSNRFELELLQENLSNLLQRYAVEETDPEKIDEDEVDAQEQNDDPIQTPTSGLSPTHTTSNPQPENKGMCYVM